MFGGALAAAGSSYFLTLGKPETYQHIVGGATFLICCGAILVDVVTTRGLEREGGIDALMSGGKLTTGLQSAAGRSWVQAEGAKLLEHESEASSFYDEALAQFRESEDELGVAQALVGLDVSPLVFLIGVNVLFLLLGCVLDATTIILVIIPLFLPTCRELGIDLVHFGVVAVVNCMIGLITPPYGILLFVINAVTQIPLREIIGEIWAFLGVLIVALACLILFPGIVLWLPRLFGYPG